MLRLASAWSPVITVADIQELSLGWAHAEGPPYPQPGRAHRFRGLMVSLCKEICVVVL